ncbi:MAG: hypothetical protein HQK75_15455 [Candidatus Magnetomorum sp.]|nr:hypothetical protein [Candidatus Magnetomorum sp.]
MGANQWKKGTIRQVERLKSWSKTRKYRCASCRSEHPPSVETSEGRFCVACMAKSLKENLLKAVDIQAWTLNQFADFLKKGSAVERLLVLWRFEEVILIVGRNEGEKIFQLYQPLIKNLGYIHQHPLSSHVRQTAHEAAVFAGESILPILVCTQEGVPAVHYANAVLTAATISPDHVEVQRMLKKAAYNNNAGLKKILLNAFENIEEQWVLPLIDIMRSDSDSSIKDKAKVISQKRNDVPSSSTQSTKKVREIKVLPEFLNHIHSNYSIDSLKMIYDEYLHQFFDMHYFGMRNHVIKSKLKKHDLAHAFAVLLSDEDNFWLFMDAVHEDVYIVFERLAWEGGELSAVKLNKTLSEKISMLKEEDHGGQILKRNVFNPKYSIFRVRKVHHIGIDGEWDNHYYLSLSQFLRNHVMKFLPKPQYYHLISVTEVPKDCHIFSDKDTMLFQIPLILNYVQDGKLLFSETTEKPSKKNLNDMMSYCSIDEFYPSGNYEEKYIRTNLLACFFQALHKQKIDLSLTPEKQLKHIINRFHGGADRLFNYFKTLCLLSHIKGWRKVFDTYHDEYHFEMEMIFRKELGNLLKQLTVGEWIGIDNIIKYCFYRNISVEIVHHFVANQYIYCQHAANINGKWVKTGGRTYVSEANYPNLITKPAIKMYMFFMASLGILDIAYIDPQNDEIRSNNRPYFSEYDGIQYIRLTDLGAYILEKTDSYDFDHSKISTQVVLDDEHLIAYIKGADPVKRIILDKIADMIHDGCYRMNYQSFLKGCRSSKDIDLKIELFQQHISNDPPAIWKAFIAEITAKKDPLKEQMNMRVFKVKENQELIDLIAKDDFLRQHVLISEEYHIIIKEKNIKNVQKRLEDFGFFNPD